MLLILDTMFANTVFSSSLSFGPRLNLGVNVIQLCRLSVGQRNVSRVFVACFPGNNTRDVPADARHSSLS